MHLFLARWLRRLLNIGAVLLQVILERERTAIGRAANVAAEFQIIVLLVGFNVSAHRVQRGKWPRTLGAMKGLRVTVLVAGELNACFKCLWTEGTIVGANVAVCEEMMIVDG